VRWLKPLLRAADSYAELDLEAGHFVMREHSEATVKAILEHLGQADRAGRTGAGR
jgi:hypothetical protein